jgi:hypothetical protein
MLAMTRDPTSRRAGRSCGTPQHRLQFANGIPTIDLGWLPSPLGALKNRQITSHPPSKSCCRVIRRERAPCSICFYLSKPGSILIQGNLLRCGTCERAAALGRYDVLQSRLIVASDQPDGDVAAASGIQAHEATGMMISLMRYSIYGQRIFTNFIG